MNGLDFLASGPNAVVLALLAFAAGWACCMAYVGYRSKERERMLKVAKRALDRAASLKKAGDSQEEARAAEARQADLLRQIRDEAASLT